MKIIITNHAGGTVNFRFSMLDAATLHIDLRGSVSTSVQLESNGSSAILETGKGKVSLIELLPLPRKEPTPQ